MANICNNLFYAYSEDRENIETVYKFFNTHYVSYNVDEVENGLDICFDSKWIFPRKEMIELYNTIPNKEDIYMRCLSYEFGNMYHSLWECDKDGWRKV